jgi:DeoR/GlpR family transcriptional regulator of sugar metabolism
MRIFLSHSSRQKPLVREVRNHLPHHLATWLDEERLLFGDAITSSLEKTIKTDSDYVLLFLDHAAAMSPWVRQELRWALAAEVDQRRTIVLPILVDSDALPLLEHPELEHRRHLRLGDYTETAVRSLAETISGELFALICRDMDRLHKPAPKSQLDTIADAETLLKANATLIQKAVFPHRQSNPISRAKLLEILNAYTAQRLSEDAFDALIASVQHRGLIPGLSYDGFEAFLVEEHSSWKADVEHDKKEKIGRKVVTAIKNGMKVFLDAGSTTEEIVRLLCRKIESRLLTNALIATTSVNIADMISDCCVRMGFDDDFSAVRLFIPGGRIRPNTQAIVGAFGNVPRQILSLSELVDGFDLCVVGVNGVDSAGGFTTHANDESLNKMDILSVSAKRFIAGDSSKLGIVLPCRFAGFHDAVTLVVDNDPVNEHLAKILRDHPEKVLLA